MAQELAMKLTRLFPLSALLSALALPSAAQTPPTTPVGTTSAIQTVALTLSASGTVSSINLLTQGAPNQDYQFASGGTCTVGKAYTTGQTCTVKYTFEPTHPGTRYGAAVLYDNATPANAIATAYLNGTGTGPQATSYFASTEVLPDGLDIPCGLAIDGKGNLFTTGSSTPQPPPTCPPTAKPSTPASTTRSTTPGNSTTPSTPPLRKPSGLGPAYMLAGLLSPLSDL